MPEEYQPTPHQETNHPDQIIIAEFNYIAGTAFQANEDRARVSQFFFVTFGTFIAALFSSQLENVNQNQIYLAFTVIFLLLASFGGLTLLQLARLRLAWRESARAMNQIKEQAAIQYPHMENYFRWTNATLPAAFKPNSVGALLAIMVALLGGLATGTAVAFLGLASGAQTPLWMPSIALGLIGSVFLFAICYWHPLR